MEKLLGNTFRLSAVLVTALGVQGQFSQVALAQERSSPVVPRLEAGVYLGPTILHQSYLPPLVYPGAPLAGEAGSSAPASPSAAVGVSALLHARLGYLPANLDAVLQADFSPGAQTIRFRAAGSTLYVLHLHDFSVRAGAGAPEFLRIMAGLGATFDLGRFLRVFASVGLTALEAQRPMLRPLSMMGGYVGGAVAVRVWRIRGELRMAYWMGFTNEDSIGETIASFSDSRSRSLGFRILEQVGNGLPQGLIAEGNVQLEAVQIDHLLRISPEARVLFNSLPSGSEVLITLGVSGALDR